MSNHTVVCQKQRNRKGKASGKDEKWVKGRKEGRTEGRMEEPSNVRTLYSIAGDVNMTWLLHIPV